VYEAIKTQQPEMVQLLLAHNAKPTEAVVSFLLNLNLLIICVLLQYFAVLQSDLPCLRALIASGIDVNAKRKAPDNSIQVTNVLTFSRNRTLL